VIGSGPPAVDLGIPEPPGSRWRDLTSEQGARGALVAAASTVLVLGLVLWWVLSSEAWPSVQQQFFNPENFAEAWPDVLGGFWLDVRMFLVAEVAILAFSLLLAVIRALRGPAFFPLRTLTVVYIDVMRGIPIILIILLLGFGIPALDLPGVPRSRLFWGLTALVLSYSAYTAEVYRAGIESVHESQRMSARALGLTQWQALQYVLVPQAVRNVVPALLNGFVSLQKDVALVYILGIREAVREAQIYNARTFNYTGYVVAAVLFLAVSIPVARFADWYTERDRRRRRAG
jgi:polar amino acid transport system permease protein